MVHACDIGNPLLPFDTYMNWSYLLAQEFNEQVTILFLREFNDVLSWKTIKEAKQGLEVMEMFKFVDYKKYLDGQLFFSSKLKGFLLWNFIIIYKEILVCPLWTEIVAFLPDLKHLLESLQKNIKILETKKSSL